MTGAGRTTSHSEETRLGGEMTGAGRTTRSHSVIQRRGHLDSAVQVMRREVLKANLTGLAGINIGFLARETGKTEFPLPESGNSTRGVVLG